MFLVEFERTIMSDTDIDANAAGFIEGPPRGFPNLKTFGGFDAMPDLRVGQYNQTKYLVNS